MRCLRRCRARPSALNVLASVVSTDTSPIHQFDSSQSTVDVDAGASGASGRARISGLIGLLMRPRKAKGRRARRITVELAYCSSSTFPPSSSILKRQGAPATLNDQAMGSVDLIPPIFLNAHHGLREAFSSLSYP